MIVTPEEYLDSLFLLQSNNPPSFALIPNSEKIYPIDLTTRKIENPDFLSVENDHTAETIYFSIDRYSDYVDLATTSCVIQYINANNEAFLYPVPFYDITTLAHEKKIIIPWCIDGAAAAASGNVKYSFRFYKLSSDSVTPDLIYNLNTQPAISKILHGMDKKKFDESYQIPGDIASALNAKIDMMIRQQLYWDEAY